MILREETIRKYLSRDILIRLYDSVDSTNNEAKRRMESGYALYATTHQTAGRGRRGHSFYSPKDTGLYMTLSLPLSGEAEKLQKLTCASAVAVCDAVTALSGRHPKVKWVNDILLDGRKTAGILAELVTDESNLPRAVIVGIGLNLRTEDFPAEFAQKAGNLGDIEPNALCGTIAENLIERYLHLDDISLMEKYKTLNLCIGHEVSFTKDGCTHLATAVDIGRDGGLVVEESGEQHTLNSGEISIVITH